MKNSSFYLTMVLLLLVLIACGGEDAASEPVAPAETEAAAPTEPTPEPTSEDVTVDESAASGESKPEATEEMAPAEPTPTEMAAEEESAPAGEEPTEEAAPAGDEVAAAGDGWGASGTTAQSACDHPYFPMRTGSTWTFTDGENTLVWTVTDVQGGLDSATAMMQATVSDITIDYVWDCAAGEGMSSFDFANLGFSPAGVGMTIEQTSADGVYLLPADQLQPGATWTMNLASTFNFTQTEGGTEMEVTGEMTNEQQNTVISANPVTFEGQTVDGVQIEQINNIVTTMTIMGNSIEQPLNASGTHELGWGIGMINQTSTTDFGTDTLQLVSYFVP